MLALVSLRVIFLFFLLAFVGMSNLPARDINLTTDECVFVKYPVPEKGIVCSNHERALRLSKRLDNSEIHKSAWGPFVIVGDYRGEQIFVACAPVGTGSGLLFTELYVNGAKYIVRYGSDDVKSPPESDAYLVKIVDEADNLYGFNVQSGVDPKEWGESVEASPEMVEALVSVAKEKNILYEMRICHHLENYHALRCPDKFSPARNKRLTAILEQLNKNAKPSSYDMETAVLFRVAKDFRLHAVTILQTVDKENSRVCAYEGENYQRAIEYEEGIFFNYVLDALLKV